MLAGRPLIAWTVEAARNSHTVGDIVLSTEDAEVARAARALGVEVLQRPDELAQDSAGVVQVALHALAELRSRGREYDRLIILLPTSPLRNASDIDKAVSLFEEKDGQFLLSVSPYDHTPYSALTVEDGIARPVFPEYLGKPSQRMPAAFRPNGAIHVLSVPIFERTKSYVSQPLLAYVMPWPRSIDVDTQADLDLAEVVIARERG
jgi:CMP-N-acetylneuraminic acid synthetase